jgi:hypothetical protein
MPWVAPCAVAVTIEQCRAWAGCGARLKAAIALTATAAISNLLMALSSLRIHGDLLSHAILPDLLPNRRGAEWGRAQSAPRFTFGTYRKPW